MNISLAQYIPGDEATAEAVNRVAAFLAMSGETALIEAFSGRREADVLVLLGNAAIPVTDAAAGVWRDGIAGVMLIAGGVGHSTKLLREAVAADSRYDGFPLECRPEAEIMLEMLVRWHNISSDEILLETQSANCGANATESRRVLDEAGLHTFSGVLMQDPTMLRRSHASFAQVWQDRPEVVFRPYSPLIPRVRSVRGRLAFSDELPSLWTMERFLSLIMGEIPRLRDDESGYGPRGRGFIAHVDIPPAVESAFRRLESSLPQSLIGR